MIRKLLVATALAAMVLPVAPAHASATSADGCTEDLLARLGSDTLFPDPDPVVERDPATGSVTIHPSRVQPAADAYAGFVVGSVNFVVFATAEFVDCVT